MTMQISRRYDVICAGGGVSGVFAAVRAARGGARVLLVERAGLLGGAAALGLPLRGASTPDTALQQAFWASLDELNGCTVRQDAALRSVNGETVRLALHRLCRESGAELLLSAEADALRMEGGAAAGVSVLGKSGRMEFDAPVVIDATGVGDLLRGAGLLERDPPLAASAVMTLTGLAPSALCGNEAESTDFANGARGASRVGPLVPGGAVCTVTVGEEPGRLLVELPLERTVIPADPRSWTRAIRGAHLQMLALLRALNGQNGGETVRLSSAAPQLRLHGAPKARHGADAQYSAVCAAALQRERCGVPPGDILVPGAGGLMACGALAAGDGTGQRAFATGEAAGICAAAILQTLQVRGT